MNFAIIMAIIYSLLLLIFFLAMFGGRIRPFFHLVSSEQLMGEESWDKLNQLWQVGEADISTYDFSDGKTWSVRLSYKDGKNGRVSNSFDSQNVNEAVSKAYDWAKQRGYIKQ